MLAHQEFQSMSKKILQCGTCHLLAVPSELMLRRTKTHLTSSSLNCPRKSKQRFSISSKLLLCGRPCWFAKIGGTISAASAFTPIWSCAPTVNFTASSDHLAIASESQRSWSPCIYTSRRRGISAVAHSLITSK